LLDTVDGGSAPLDDRSVIDKEQQCHRQRKRFRVSSKAISDF
jgi:hypothetical protein